MPEVGRYSGLARGLHWLSAAMVLTIGVLGVWITRFEPAEEAFKLRLYNLHESLGVVLFGVTVARLAWRWRVGTPVLPAGVPAVPAGAPTVPAGMSALARVMAGAVHGLMYAVLLVQPVVGFLATNAWGFPLVLFGVLAMPVPVGTDVGLAEALSAVHQGLAVMLGLLLAAHLGGVLMHALVWRDGLLRRML